MKLENETQWVKAPHGQSLASRPQGESWACLTHIDTEEMAKEAPDMAMNLSHYMDLEWFMEAYRKTRKDGALGIDGQTAKDYEESLEENLRSLMD